MIGVRVLPRFPARVETGAGLEVEREAGTYSFSLDFESLSPATAIADGDTTFIPAWDSDQDAYTRLSANAFGSVLSAGFSGVSSSTVSVGTGSKTFTASLGKAWTAGQRLRVANADSSRVMSGIVTSYNSVSGELIIDVDYTHGASSDSAWTIVIGGEVGPDGAAGAGSGDVVGPAGSTDGVVALFDGASGVLLKEGLGPLGALAYADDVDLTAEVTGDLPFANIAQIATDRLAGRDTAGTGDIEELTVGGGLEFTGSGGIQRSALTGDVTATAGSGTTAIASGVVTFAKVASAAIASEGEAEAGTATNKLMTPERTAQAIAALGPALAPLASGTVASAATLDISLSGLSAYKKLQFILTDFVPASDNQPLCMRTSTDGGATFAAGASDYGWTAHELDTADTASADSADTRILVSVTGGNQASEGVSLTVDIYGHSGTTSYKKIRSEGTGLSGTPTLRGFYVAGVRWSTADIDAVRFLFNSGNIASGTWSLYGFL